MLLNDELISQIPGLGSLLNTIGDTLLGNLDLSDGDGGLGSLDNLLIVKLPLVPGIPDGGLDGFGDIQFEDTLIAVCDPSTPGENCALALNIALDPLALRQLADAFTGGDPSQIPGLLAEALIGEDGVLSINLAVLDPNGLGVLPGPLEDAVNLLVSGLQTALDRVPVLNQLFANFGVEPLINANLLNGALLDATVGNLLGVSVLDLSTGSLIDLSGGLADALDPLLGPLSRILCPIRLLCIN